MNIWMKLRIAILASLALGATLVSSVPASAGSVTVVEVDVAGTGSGDTNADVLVNGNVFVLDHLVEARRHKGVDTLQVQITGVVESVEVRFDNDGPGNNLFVRGLRVDGVIVDLTDGRIVRANGAVLEVENTAEAPLWTDGSYMIDFEQMEAPAATFVPGSGRQNRYFPDDTDFNYGGGETLAKVCTLLAERAETRPINFDSEGHIVDDTPADAIVIEVPAPEDGSDSVTYIEEAFSDLPVSMTEPGAHVVVQLASGEHRFAKKLRFTRGNVTIRGAGTTGPDRTLITHDFEDEDNDHAIEFHAPAINHTVYGFVLGSKVPDEQLLGGIALRDFAITYKVEDGDIRDQEIEGGLTVEDLRELGNQNWVPRYAVWDKNGVENLATLWQQQAAIALDGVIDANLVNLRTEMVGSHGIGIYESVGVFADELVADGALNRGGGGNGYGLEVMQSHDSVIRFDAVIDNRHVSINNATDNDNPVEWSTNNVIAVEYSNTNLDFHKLTEDANILYVENAVANPFVYPNPVGNPWRWELYTLRDDRASWGLFEDRPGKALNNNTWYGDNQISAGALYKEGEPVASIDPLMKGQLCNANLKETLRASTNNGLIYGGSQHDQLIAGEGENTFVFAADFGADEVLKFGPEDRIAFQAGSYGMQSVADVLSMVSYEGDDVLFTFPAEDYGLRCWESSDKKMIAVATIRIADVRSFFTPETHIFIDTFSFYDDVDRDFAAVR